MHRGESYIKSLKGKKVLVVGMGKSGKAAAYALLEVGASVSIQDAKESAGLDKELRQLIERKEVRSYLGSVPSDMSEFDLLVMSPGVPTKLDFIIKAAEAGVEIVGELELAYRLGEGKFVAITGTNGKTTTTTLVGEIFENSGRKTAVVGNIGNPVVKESIRTTEDNWLITEVSSFQLETTKDFRPVISAILNLEPDHLNRHGSYEAYCEAKARISMNQNEDDYLVVNADDEDVLAFTENSKAKRISFSRKKSLTPGACLDGNRIIVNDAEGREHYICRNDELRIVGDHNVENVLAAALICVLAGIDDEIIAGTIKNFPGVEHRVEFCGEVDGVQYYNDSKGTNVSASVTAIKALKNDIVLIAGGDAKGQDFSEFTTYFKDHVSALVLLGRDAGLIEESARQIGFDNIYRCSDMAECVNTAAEVAGPGAKVLLSPACASWDMYDNFEQRGEHFKQCVADLLR